MEEEKLDEAKFIATEFLYWYLFEQEVWTPVERGLFEHRDTQYTADTDVLFEDFTNWAKENLAP